MALKLENYTLTIPLGKGAFGVVFRAEDERKCVFAVKRFRSTRDDGGKETKASPADASREIVCVTRLSKITHPHIVNVHHLLTDPGDSQFLAGMAIVFEYCGEGTLLQFIETRRKMMLPLTPFEIVCLAKHLLSGLAVLHEKKFVHRDIAPPNVFVSRDAADRLVFKIGDYGRCCYLERADSLASAGNFSLHAVPETDLSLQSDVFGVGVCLFEAMTLKSLTMIASRDDLIVEHKNIRAELDTLTAKYGSALVSIVQKMMTESPSQRLDALNALRALGDLRYPGLIVFSLCSHMLNRA